MASESTEETGEVQKQIDGDPKRFGLSNINGLYLDPRDPDQAKIYVGRDDVQRQITDKIMGSSIPEGDPLRMVFFGNYGSGKTHSLYHFAQLIKEKGIYGKKVHTVGDSVGLYVKISAPAKKTFSDVYKDIVSDSIGRAELEEWIFAFMDKMVKKFSLRQRNVHEEDKIEKITEFLKEETGYNVEELTRIVIERYKLDVNTPKTNTIWKWLSGHKCGPPELKELGVNDDNTDPNIAMRNLIAIFKMFSVAYEDKVLVLMFDEMEQLAEYLSHNDLVSYEAALRNLLDVRDIGLLFTQTGSMATTNSLFNLDALKTRIGQNTYTLEQLTAVGSGEGGDAISWFKEFLAAQRPPGDDWKKYVEEAKEAHEEGHNGGITEELFPFTEGAATQAITNISQGDIGITPRTVLNSFGKIMAISLSRDKERKIFDTAGFA